MVTQALLGMRYLLQEYDCSQYSFYVELRISLALDARMIGGDEALTTDSLR